MQYQFHNSDTGRNVNLEDRKEVCTVYVTAYFQIN